MGMAKTKSEKERARDRERAAEWYRNADAATKERLRLRNKAAREANPERHAEYSRRWRERNPKKRRAAWIKCKYRLTDEQYQQLLEHHGICDSCGADDAKHIDHDHATGAFRGQLCPGCNRAAGFLKDDPERAMALAAYLLRVRKTVA